MHDVLEIHDVSHPTDLSSPNNLLLGFSMQLPRCVCLGVGGFVCRPAPVSPFVYSHLSPSIGGCACLSGPCVSTYLLSFVLQVWRHFFKSFFRLLFPFCLQLCWRWWFTDDWSFLFTILVLHFLKICFPVWVFGVHPPSRDICLPFFPSYLPTDPLSFPCLL